MTSLSDVQPDKHGGKSYLVDSHAKTNTPHSNKCPLEPYGAEDEDEEEDVDFNPFLIGSPSAEACSSLSSEVDGFDADVVDSTAENVLYLSTHSSSHQICNRKSHSSADAVKGKVSLLQRELSFLHGSDGETSSRNCKKRKSTSVSGSTDGPVRGKDNRSSSGTEAVGSNVSEMELKSPNSKKPVIDFNDDDAICKRTRARYSLTSITLDELESFLQETDDDDDLQHIDDEEEYRKFLAAVLQGGPQDDHTTLEEGNDEDEDNDADFEIEIEEALESDLDLEDRCLKLSSEAVEGRRPETRKNKHNNSSKESKRKLSELTKRPLRPLLPVLPTAPVAPNPSMNGGYLMPEAAHSLSSSQDYLVNEFLPCQIGQLYSLIYEHVQLLIQVYSLSVLEPSRHQIASQIQGLLSEMVQKREEILTKKSVPHPSFCFDPQYFRSLQTDGLGLDSSGSSRKNDDTGGLSSSDCSRQASGNVLHADEVSAQSALGPPDSSHDIQGLSWLPFAGGPVFSVLDVAPLKFVGKYIDDISTAVQEHQRSFLDATTNIYLEKEPLFPLPDHKSIIAVRNTAESSGQLSSLSTQSPSKKTLAATLIENTKKQCVALVPKPVARLALQFYPLLNPALFPRKPPSLQVANRFLFTDAEDELLAMGLMEYNSDWKAIQQRFLPCKSKHQIFVRQKNRCSSKAPDNPIKAVRRMKTAPLTEEEKARIQEGLNVFKLDWMFIWKFVVPYRDPSLLPRQWRIATGTQKSYKMDSAKKERRRLYEFNKRNRNAATGSSLDPEKEAENARQRRTGDHSMGNDHEAYVHEGFLADWRPPYTRSVSSAISAPLILSGSLPAPSSARVEMVRSELRDGNLGQSSRGHTHELATSFKNTCAAACGTSNTVQIGQTPCLTLNQPVYRRYRARRFKSSQMVKLAPDLPPVNLPPSVRIISQAAFRNSHDGRSVAKTGSGPSLGDRPPLRVIAARQNASKTLSPKQMLVPSQEPALLKHGNGPDKNCTGSDLQMHPLLFRTTKGAHLPYYPLNCSARALSSFTFLPINAPQTNLQNPCSGGYSESTCSRKSVPATSILDFHPLLQRGGTQKNSAIDACPTAPSSVGPKGSKNALRASQTVCSAGKSATEYVDKAKSTPSLYANGLNLEINLNYAPSKEEDSGRKGWIQGNLMASPVSAMRSDDGVIGIQRIQANNSRGVDCEDTMYSESLPEIVMDQEELSDSDDEIEEVEFECEEMEDSEGEEER